MTRVSYFCILFYSKINEKRVILVDYDSWEAEYSLKYIFQKTVIRLIFYGIKINENKVLSTKPYVDMSNFS